MKKKKDIKEGDIFHVSYKERSWGDQKDHCFEGILIAKLDEEKELWFVDTFWGINRWDNEKWQYKDVIKIFNLKYYNNLNNLEPIAEHECQEYEDVDLFNLHDQHACMKSCIYWYKTKGAKKSTDKKISVLRERIKEEKQTISSALNSIEWISAEIKELEINGIK